LKEVPDAKDDPKFDQREMVLVISRPGKKFRNVVQPCVLLRKNFRNGVPACYVIKIPVSE
jgi:hypothetical protein